MITLPEYHVTANYMHDLAKKVKKHGIYGYVDLVQRPERIKFEKDDSYTYYTHQRATGTGLDNELNIIIGSHDTNSLSDSTESDDIKKRYD